MGREVGTDQVQQRQRGTLDELGIELDLEPRIGDPFEEGVDALVLEDEAHGAEAEDLAFETGYGGGVGGRGSGETEAEGEEGAEHGGQANAPHRYWSR